MHIKKIYIIFDIIFNRFITFMVLKIDKKYESEFELYYTLLSVHNVVLKWGLSETQIQILIHILRFGYSKQTKEIIKKNLGITENSLITNLSYLRQGKVGNRNVKKLLEVSPNNINITLLTQDLKNIKSLIETKDGNRGLYFQFNQIANIKSTWTKEDVDNTKNRKYSIREKNTQGSGDTDNSEYN